MANIKPFYQDLAIGSAFLGARAQRLADLLSQQGDEFFRAAGIVIPVRTVSIVLYLRQFGPSSLVQIAAALDEPHQVTAKRTAQLEKLSMLSREDDPHDKRRKFFRLTRRGSHETKRIEARCKHALAIFEDINRELDVHLGDALDAAYVALTRSSMLSRSTED